jgi:hypothetical protein
MAGILGPMRISAQAGSPPVSRSCVLVRSVVGWRWPADGLRRHRAQARSGNARATAPRRAVENNCKVHDICVDALENWFRAHGLREKVRAEPRRGRWSDRATALTCPFYVMTPTLPPRARQRRLRRYFASGDTNVGSGPCCMVRGSPLGRDEALRQRGGGDCGLP